MSCVRLERMLMGNNACFCTEYGLPESLKRNLATGLEARWTELWNQRKAGYGSDATKGQREALISDARQAYALGIITHLPSFVPKVDE